NGGKNSLNRLIRCVCGKKIGPDPRNFNQRVSLGRNDLLIRTFLNSQKKYNIDFSAGIIEYDEEIHTECSAIMQDADERMYEIKKGKR
ncbi:hypothetical protein PXW73_27830, partial [Klebsiella pneumoniae]|nr:hypothetical protein [Klebsiella pneumoniae]